MLVGAGLLLMPAMASASPSEVSSEVSSEISVELPKETTPTPENITGKVNESSPRKLGDLAQINVRVEGLDGGNAGSGTINTQPANAQPANTQPGIVPAGSIQSAPVQNTTAPGATVQQTVQQSTQQPQQSTQRPTVNIRRPKLPNIRPQITPNADINLGPARVTFPNNNPAPGTVAPNATTPGSATSNPAVTNPAVTNPAVSNPAVPGVTTPNARPSIVNPAVGSGAVRPSVGGPVPATSYGAPAVINLTTFQPTPGGFAPTAAFGGATQATAPSNIQLVCTPGSATAQRAGGVAQAVSQGGVVSNTGTGVAGTGITGGVVGGLGQQGLGSVLNPGGAARRPGLFGGLIPNPTVGLDVGPVTLDVPIPISALFNLGRGRGGNQAANQANPAGTVPAVTNPVNGAPVTTAAGVAQPGVNTAAGNPVAGNPVANNPYVPPFAPVANMGGPFGGTMPVMTQVVTSQHTIINLTTLQPVANSVSNRTTNVGLNTAADAPTVQASTVQLVCNPGVN